jgi:ribosomal protein L40E
MEMDLMRISQKPHDYKVCLNCGSLNWYENEFCCKCEHNIFTDNHNKINDTISDYYSEYADLGYSEFETDNIYVEV